MVKYSKTKIKVFLSDSQPGTKLNMAKQELKVKTNKPETLQETFWETLRPIKMHETAKPVDPGLFNLIRQLVNHLD